MGEAKDKARASEVDSLSSVKPCQRSIAEEIVAQHKEGKLVYCRFGKKYLANLEKQMNSLLPGNQATVSTSAKSASFLINVKKLIKDHNIDSEHNFAKMKTKNNISKDQDGPVIPYYYPESESDQTLVFESRFESGNLLAAIKVADNEYDLILQNDINTYGHTQWYFFRVSNTTRGSKVKFNMINLAKNDSLYN